MADYEEQVLITGVKSGKHCTICQVPPDQREKLQSHWPFRSHEYTLARIRKQKAQRTLPDSPPIDSDPDAEDSEGDAIGSDSGVNEERSLHARPAYTTNNNNDDTAMDIHIIRNFAWYHEHLNVHRAQFVDILHQLLKGIIMAVLKWCKHVLREVRPDLYHPTTATANTGKRKRTKVDGPIDTLIDERFRSIPAYPGLKLFSHFSKVKQWTGDEQKAMIRQMVPVFTPFFFETKPAALLCLRAILDFVVLAMYVSHTDETLGYMDAALENIDRLKGVFKNARPKDPRTGQGHFNFPKFHAITHIPDFIREYGSAPGINSDHGETAHKFSLKDFLPRTNKNHGFNEQILLHNVRRQNILAMDDILLYARSQKITQADEDERLQVNMITKEPTNPSYWGIQPPSPMDTNIRSRYKLPYSSRWFRARDIRLSEGRAAFRYELAAFVMNSRIHQGIPGYHERRNSENHQSPTEDDMRYTEDMFISVYPSMTCWLRLGKDINNGERLDKQKAGCQPNWNKEQGVWRRDHVWVRDETAPNGLPEAIQDSYIGRLDMIFQVFDTREDIEGRTIFKADSISTYTGVFVQLFKWRSNGMVHPIHGMAEVEHWPQNDNPRTQRAGRFRIYDVSRVLHRAHVIPRRSFTSTNDDVFLVNNWISFEEYNRIYDENFVENNKAMAIKWSRGL
jgi:hypothetical protein